MSPERTQGERDNQRLRVELPDGTVQVWQTGTRLRQGQRYGRGAPTEVRHIGKRGVRVEGDVPRTSYHAQLVTTVRVASKRRQRIIAYLGSYQDGEQDDLDARTEFWRAGLDVPDDVKARIVTKVAERMPRPTAAEVEAAAGACPGSPPA